MAGARPWTAVASSSDGSHLIAVAAHIYISTDYGVHWTAQAAPGAQNWEGVSSSADGSHLVATYGGAGGEIWTSSDYGADWTDQTVSTPAANQNYDGVSSSASGQYVAARVYNGDIWLSNDYGVTWTDQTNLGFGYWNSVAYSANGNVIAVAQGGGDNYVSYNQGSTWVDQATLGAGPGSGWFGITLNADGSRAAVVNYSGDIWTGYDPSLVSQIQSSTSSPSPTANSPDTGYGQPYRSEPVITILSILGVLSIVAGLRLSHKQKRT